LIGSLRGNRGTSASQTGKIKVIRKSIQAVWGGGGGVWGERKRSCPSTGGGIETGGNEWLREGDKGDSHERKSQG